MKENEETPDSFPDLYIEEIEETVKREKLTEFLGTKLAAELLHDLEKIRLDQIVERFEQKLNEIIRKAGEEAKKEKE